MKVDYVVDAERVFAWAVYAGQGLPRRRFIARYLLREFEQLAYRAMAAAVHEEYRR